MRLTELKGIGEKTEEIFARAGVESVEDLLEFFPRDYEIFSEPVAVSEIGYRTFAAVRGAFAQPLFERRVKNLRITTAMFKDEVGQSIKVTWFNAPFMKKNVSAMQTYILRGRISRKYGVLQLNQPKVYSPEQYAKQMKKMQPVYPLTKGLTNALITKAVRQAMSLPVYDEVCAKEPIPEAVRERYGLCGREFAIRNLHFPENASAFKAAAGRMSFEEIFLFILAVKANEQSRKRESSFRILPDARTKAFYDQLPFRLTGAQQKVLEEIGEDMSSGYVMNRLVQGDVGSGKTIVALGAMMNAAFAGVQAALMAPTEVLAEQHFETISRLFREHGIPLHAALLTGSMTALEKRVVYDALENGRIDILIGTHALFQEKVKYHDLGLIITDEQHRFGIRQREALAGKGHLPHMIVMSATPIPRTLALIFYGDMDVSVIDELPANRRPIRNAVIDDSMKPNAYRFIEKQVAQGHQAYIICPLVAYSDEVEAQNVEDYTEMLRDIMPETISIGMLHGQMPPAQKNEIMSRFAQGKIQILVSTTVIEVGVDVPNATVMMVEDANRFGLASLHQLRGRVGRGADQSYCIFVSNNRSKEAMERLGILNTSNNGFEIASKDLEIRGPGEFMGTRQSGALSFRNFDICRDMDIARSAMEAAGQILNGDLAVSAQEKEQLKAQTTALNCGILL